jgi:flagellar basal body rod protein FlgB
MVELAKNSINYYTTVSKINSEFRKLDTAINVN